MQYLETRVPAPVVAFVIGLAMGLLPQAGAISLSGVIEPVRKIVMDLSAQVSAVVALAAFGAFLQARTTINPLRPERASVLVTHGIYRFTRNPMYLSLLLLLVSYASQLWCWAAFAGPVVYVAYITRFQILPEERVLASKFGDEFLAYKRRVRRWI